MNGNFHCELKTTSLVLFLILNLMLPLRGIEEWRSKEYLKSKSLSKNSSQKKSLEELENNDRQRDRHFQIDKALDILDIQPGMTVGEVGAGEGYLVFKLAERVGQEGIVYAEDIYPEPLELLKSRADQKDYKNIETVLGIQDDPKFPIGIFDFVFMHATIQFVKNPAKLFNSIAPSLNKKGKFVIIEPEEGRFVALGGVSPPKGTFPSRQQYLDVFAETVYKVERIDDTTLPYMTVFVLTESDLNRLRLILDRDSKTKILDSIDSL